MLGAKTDFDEIVFFWSERPNLDQKTKWKNWRLEAFSKDQNCQIWSPKRPSGNPAHRLLRRRDYVLSCCVFRPAFGAVPTQILVILVKLIFSAVFKLFGSF